MWVKHVSLIKMGERFTESGLSDILSKLFKARDLNSAEYLDSSDSMLERFNIFEGNDDLQTLLAYSYKVHGQLKYAQYVEDGKTSRLLRKTLCTNSTHRHWGGFQEHIF